MLDWNAVFIIAAVVAYGETNKRTTTIPFHSKVQTKQFFGAVGLMIYKYRMGADAFPKFFPLKPSKMIEKLRYFVRRKWRGSSERPTTNRRKELLFFSVFLYTCLHKIAKTSINYLLKTDQYDTVSMLRSLFNFFQLRWSMSLPPLKALYNQIFVLYFAHLSTFPSSRCLLLEDHCHICYVDPDVPTPIQWQNHLSMQTPNNDACKFMPDVLCKALLTNLYPFVCVAPAYFIRLCRTLSVFNFVPNFT